MTLAILAALWAGVAAPKLWLVGLGMIWYWLRGNPRALVVLVVLLLSTRTSIVPGWSAYGLPGDWAYGFVPILCYLLLTTMPLRSTAWLKWAGVALSVHALVQVAGLDPYVPVLPAGRAIAWVGTNINLAAILAMAGPVSGPFLPIILAGVWACGSRGALFAIVFAMAPSKLRWALAAMMLAFMLLSPAPKDIARVEMVRIAWRGFVASPWLGNGPSTYEAVFTKGRTKRLDAAVGTGYMQGYAHNDIAEALCSTGILGLLAYLCFIWPLRRCASLVSLFVFMKFNPAGFDVFCVAALIAANEMRLTGSDGRAILTPPARPCVDIGAAFSPEHADWNKP